MACCNSCPNNALTTIEQRTNMPLNSKLPNVMFSEEMSWDVETSWIKSRCRNRKKHLHLCIILCELDCRLKLILHPNKYCKLQTCLEVLDLMQELGIWGKPFYFLTLEPWPTAFEHIGVYFKTFYNKYPSLWASRSTPIATKIEIKCIKSTRFT